MFILKSFRLINSLHVGTYKQFIINIKPTCNFDLLMLLMYYVLNYEN